MAAPSSAGPQELPGRSELEEAAEEGSKGQNGRPECDEKIKTENTKAERRMWGEDMDANGEESKLLEKTVKEARRLSIRDDPIRQDPSDVPGPLQGTFTTTGASQTPMWGEDMDSNSDESKLLEKTLREARRLSSREDPISRDPSEVTGPLLDMFTTIGASQIPIRSQQKGDPEFSHEQKMSMLLDLYKSKPLIFLERFRKVLKEEHLDCFAHLSGDYTADFYFKEIRKASLKKVNHTRVRNKRYAALQQLISAGEYFSDEQMRARDPLMYEHYVGQYQSEEEIMSQNSREMSQASSLSDVLLNSCQEQSIQRRLEAQRDLEESCMEEEEEDSEEEESELQSDEEREVDHEERILMREEFISRMHQRFLDGKDGNFDYKEVDDNPDFDNLDIVTRDAEERYFDDDDDDDDDMECVEENGQRDSSD